MNKNPKSDLNGISKWHYDKKEINGSKEKENKNWLNQYEQSPHMKCMNIYQNKQFKITKADRNKNFFKKIVISKKMNNIQQKGFNSRGDQFNSSKQNQMQYPVTNHQKDQRAIRIEQIKQQKKQNEARIKLNQQLQINLSEDTANNNIQEDFRQKLNLDIDRCKSIQERLLIQSQLYYRRIGFNLHGKNNKLKFKYHQKNINSFDFNQTQEFQTKKQLDIITNPQKSQQDLENKTRQQYQSNLYDKKKRNTNNSVRLSKNRLRIQDLLDDCEITSKNIFILTRQTRLNSFQSNYQYNQLINQINK